VLSDKDERGKIMSYSDNEKESVFRLLVYIRLTRDLPDIYNDKILQYLFNNRFIVVSLHDWDDDGPLFGGYYLTQRGRLFLKTVGKFEAIRLAKTNDG
jgi:hypothetical protein